MKKKINAETLETHKFRRKTGKKKDNKKETLAAQNTISERK
jgi:hypothetical protein